MPMEENIQHFMPDATIANSPHCTLSLSTMSPFSPESPFCYLSLLNTPSLSNLHMEKMMFFERKLEDGRRRRRKMKERDEINFFFWILVVVWKRKIWRRWIDGEVKLREADPFFVILWLFAILASKLDRWRQPNGTILVIFLAYYLVDWLYRYFYFAIMLY